MGIHCWKSLKCCFLLECITLVFLCAGGSLSMWGVVLWLVRLLVSVEELKSDQLGSERLDHLETAYKMPRLRRLADTDLNTTVNSVDKGTAFSEKENESKILINQPGFLLEHTFCPFPASIFLCSILFFSLSASYFLSKFLAYICFSSLYATGQPWAWNVSYTSK